MVSVSSDDLDSGMESLITPGSKESSPKKSDFLALEDEIMFDDEDIDESLGERLWGLTEMFPSFLRRGTSCLASGCVSGIKNLYSFGRITVWVVFSSSTILLAPALFEVERTSVEEMQKQQQRQILLGPNAAMSGSHPMGMHMPGQMS